MSEILSEPKVCPACGTAIPTGLKFCPKCNYRTTFTSLKIKTEQEAEQPQATKMNAAPLILIVLVLCSSLLMLSSSIVNVTRLPAAPATPMAAPKDLNVEAYNQAKKFISDQFPDAKQFSDYKESPIDKTGNDYRVLVFFDSINQNGISARNVFSVELVWVGDEWKLKQIKQ